MAASPIKFGTSGWRGIIAEDFTFPNVRIAAAAIAEHV
jgi:phosphomannomutase